MSTSTSTFCIFWLSFILLPLLSRASSQTNHPPASSANRQLVTQILSYVNESASPCHDYYKYACGNWATKHKNDNYIEIIGLIDHKVNQNLLMLLTELQQQQQSLKRGSVEDKVLSFFQTCKLASQSTRLSRHYLHLVPPNDQIPWPQFKRRSEAWGSSKFQWMETLARLQRYGLTNVLFKLDTLPDLSNSSKYIIRINRPSFEEKKERLRSRILTKLTLRMLGTSIGQASRLAKSVKFLEATVSVLAGQSDECNEAGEYLTLQELEVQIGGQWRKYLEIVLGRNVPADFMVNVECSAYLRMLVDFIKPMNREVVASYIMLRFVSHLQEETMDSNDSISCVQDVRRNMELATNLLYEQRFIGPDRRQKLQTDILELFEVLRKQVLKKFETNNLRLAPHELDMMRAKLLNMTINIGNMPQGVDRARFVNDFYADLHLVGDRDYAANHLRLLEYRTRRWFDQLDRPLNVSAYFYISDSDTGMSSTPYYMLRQNLIIVPYGTLQPPIFYQDAHDVFKFSLLGFMLSHELMHGFVSGGIVYDFKGNYNEMSAGILLEDEYLSAISCLNRNETDFMDEREADIAGIRLAYDAFFDSDSKFNQSQPAFSTLSLKQLFFLNMAQFFCGDASPDDFEDHDADEMRLRQVLINFAPFAEAYGCRQDRDNMHPGEKCRLW
ncbi:membrane metallo-endopeptidase-like 1 [Drosophila hydei]|uniref:Membrane metallo-endopeptidase-like 1 n=1 Tax=Drosophila hydei TaxID=7224 RepID=A0A6J1M9E6_DROHY|nr:membrane metallo-endopeptidase-like 1 [Drosophila hydei]